MQLQQLCIDKRHTGRIHSNARKQLTQYIQVISMCACVLQSSYLFTMCDTLGILLVCGDGERGLGGWGVVCAGLL